MVQYEGGGYPLLGLQMEGTYSTYYIRMIQILFFKGCLVPLDPLLFNEAWENIKRITS
jgi:hypothetical protein